MRCSESLQEKIDALAAGELPLLTAWSVGRHAQGCAECGARLERGRALNAGLKKLEEESPSDVLRERIFEALPEVNGALTPGPSPVPGEGSARRKEIRRMRKPRLALVGTALVCTVMALAVFTARFPGVREQARSSEALSNMKQMHQDEYGQRADAIIPDQPTQAPAGAGSPLLLGGNASLEKDGRSRTARQPLATSKYSQDYDEAMPERPGAHPPTANFTSAAPDRYLIRNATLVIEVKDARDAHNTLFAAVKGVKGYLSNLQETVDGLGARTITMQVRVPASLFDSSMQRLSSLGKVMEKHVNAEDVTEEYVDTTSTLRNLKKTEARLLDHLSRTGKLSDTLLVETELTRVRQEIEQHEGRIRFLSHRVQFSTMDVTLREEAKSQPAVPAESYSTGKEAAGATRSLVEFLRNVWTTVIWIGIWGVIWVPLTLIGWWAVRWAWRSWAGTGPTRTA